MAHTSKEIPRDQWASYLADISRRVRNERVRVESIVRAQPSTRTQRVTLESLSEQTGDQDIARSLPLVEISLELKGSDTGAVQIIVGHDDDAITHRVLEPERISAEVDSDSGALECLEIIERGSGKLLVFFERELDVDSPTLHG
ncbi:hypothetical protein G4177_01855 [Corallococcus sp. ZKHCc1 1396]|uniref:Uncharacterized protein n=1 Tax=Corallococcus soli TaxID=2710757 RepID=A0ABR9PG74_9BACT|nr:MULTISPECIES: DUF5335 family protein [Corallococcus]MBE4746916.1 hypothetical protein [Corallococcus soli]MCY1030459.1 DUF5335 family protein [Corallococcus sp. BB11-1]